ncbi:MAG: CDP-alcohol phosphatidyltransferase family protein [Armatimonadota bacterium]|jgi:CDP-diacylglycerol--glycerol-3-phosphate 3-phosphatidyltransferase
MLKHVPNAICYLRIAMVPVLWVLAVREMRLEFVVLLAFTYLTDAIDGAIARKFHLETPLGARLDTWADNCVTISMIGWAYLLLPELFREHGALIGLVVAGFLGSIALQYIRYRKRVPLHLYSNKASSWVIGLFLLHAFLFGPNIPFMYIAAAAVGFALIEEIALVSTRRDIDEDVRSAFDRRFRQSPAAADPEHSREEA